MKINALNWFELYVSDFDRAKKFYDAILNVTLQVVEGCANPMAIFPKDQANGVSGALSQMEGCEPGPGGTVVYLNVEGDLDGVVERISTEGGKVLQGRLDIAPHGFIALFKDSEGNVVGLHSMI